MSIKISELPQATSVGSSDIVPIVQGGTTKQATAGMIQQTVEDLTTSITYTAETGVTITNFSAVRYGGLLLISLRASYSSFGDANKVLLRFTNLSNIVSVIGSAQVTNTSTGTIRLWPSGALTLYPAITSTECHIAMLVPMPTISSTRSLNLTKGENTGSLVGLGDKAEVTDETLEKTKLDEVAEVKEVEATEQTKEVEGSGDER